MAVETGGTAYPAAAGWPEQGMTKRDVFAKAMISAIGWGGFNVGHVDCVITDAEARRFAACAYRLADAMLAQSDKEVPPR